MHIQQQHPPYFLWINCTETFFLTFWIIITSNQSNGNISTTPLTLNKKKLKTTFVYFTRWHRWGAHGKSRLFLQHKFPWTQKTAPWLPGTDVWRVTSSSGTWTFTSPSWQETSCCWHQTTRMTQCCEAALKLQPSSYNHRLSKMTVLLFVLIFCDFIFGDHFFLRGWGSFFFPHSFSIFLSDCELSWRPSVVLHFLEFPETYLLFIDIFIKTIYCNF